MRFLRFLPALLALALPSAAEEKPAFLGVAGVPVDNEVRRAYRVGKDVTGVFITELVKKSSADRAGFRPGDVITSFGGKPVATFEALVAEVQARKAGARIAYKLRRGTGSIQGTIMLGAPFANYEVERIHAPATDKPPVSTPPATRAPTAKPKRPRKPADLDKRLDNAERDMAELLEKARKNADRKKPRAKAKDGDAAPGGLVRWLKREERLLRAARKAQNAEKIVYHSARLSVLREMRDAGVRLPPRRADRLEKKLDQVLRLLRQRD